MSERYISVALRRLVVARAAQCCEYCRLPDLIALFPHEVDHVIAIKHLGMTDEHNLAYSCWRCNRHKGTDLGSFDPVTQLFSVLFNPRTQQWHDHFHLQSALLRGVTPEGRTTERLLQFNTEDRVAERQRLIDIGYFIIPSSEI